MNKTVLHRKLFKQYKKSGLNYKLPVILGVNEKGESVFADLVDLKHILMAGSTGSGKSMFLHTLISTLLSLNSPNQVKLLLIDMKRVELLSYNRLPYLLAPVIVNIDSAFKSLQWLIDEKERRLKIMKDIDKFPFLVVIIDTFSDLMAYDEGKFQEYISKLVNKVSDVKIHFIMSDSRPSADLYTLLIKSLFPTKICFNVSEDAHSKLIIGASGGEKLRGVGDMLFSPIGSTGPVRLQAPFISEREIAKVNKY